MLSETNKHSAVTDVTREAFITAFFLVVKDKSVRQVSIRELTEKAGYNRTTFYRYFTDIYDLLDSVMDETLANFSQALAEESKHPVFDASYFEKFLVVLKENANRYRVLLADEHRMRLMEKIEKAFAQNATGIETLSDTQQMVMCIYFNGVFAALYRYLSEPDLLSEEELLQIIQNLFRTWYWPYFSANEKHPDVRVQSIRN